MIARKVVARLKPNALTKLKKVVEGEILPWLQTQEGFVDLITLAAPDGREIAAISFWDHKQNGHAANSSGYPEALEILGELLEGTPHLRTFDVVSSTLPRVAPASPPEAANLFEGTGSTQPGYRSCETSV